MRPHFDNEVQSSLGMATELLTDTTEQCHFRQYYQLICQIKLYKMST